MQLAVSSHKRKWIGAWYLSHEENAKQLYVIAIEKWLPVEKSALQSIDLSTDLKKACNFASFQPFIKHFVCSIASLFCWKMKVSCSVEKWSQLAACASGIEPYTYDVFLEYCASARTWLCTTYSAFSTCYYIFITTRLIILVRCARSPLAGKFLNLSRKACRMNDFLQGETKIETSNESLILYKHWRKNFESQFKSIEGPHRRIYHREERTEGSLSLSIN